VGLTQTGKTWHVSHKEVTVVNGAFAKRWTKQPLIEVTVANMLTGHFYSTY